MAELEQLLALFLAAVLLAAGARRVGAPYPVFLAVGGALLAFVPGAPQFTVPPELALALFIAPILLDAAYDASPRDLRDNWLPLTSLVVFAVVLTTLAVAWVARALVPGHAVGAGDRARRGRGAARRRRGHRGAPAAAPAAPHPDDPRGREPAERRQRAADLSPRDRRGRCRRRLLDRRDCADVHARGRRQHRRRSGARRDHASRAGSRRARAERDHPAVRHHVRRLDPRRAHRPVGRADHGVLRHHRGAAGAGADSGAIAHSVLRGVGDGGLRPEHPGVHLHRPADPADSRLAPAGRIPSATSPSPARCW